MARINICAATVAVFISLLAVSSQVSGEPEWAHKIVELFHQNRLVNCELDSTNAQVDGIFGALLQCFVRCKGHFAKFDYKHDGTPCNTATMEPGACHAGACQKLTTSSAVLPITTGRPKQDWSPSVPPRVPGTTLIENSRQFETVDTTMTTLRAKTWAPATNLATTARYRFDSNRSHPPPATTHQSTESASSMADHTTGSRSTSQRSVLSEETTRHQRTKQDSHSPNFLTQTASSVVASADATSSEIVPVTFHFNPITPAPTEDLLSTPVAVDAVTPWPYIIITDFAYKFAPPARVRPAASDSFK